MIYFSIFVFLILLRLSQILLSNRISTYFKDGPTGDASTYFFLIQFFRHHSCGSPDNRCLISNKPVSVPSMFMKIVANIFSDKILFKYSWLPNFVFFCCGALFFSWLLRISSENVDYIAFIIVTLLFITQCDNMNFDMHKVHYLALQPRFLGLLSNSAFWVIYLFFGFSSFYVAIILLTLLFIALNISIFSRQTVIFSVTVFSIIDLNYYIPLILIGAVILSSIAFRKEFLPSIKPQLEYSFQYFKNFYKPRAHKNRIVNFVKVTFSRALIIDSYLYFTFFILVLLLTLIKLDILRYAGKLDDNILNRVFVYCISITIVFGITGLRKFAFIGECWRYISFTNYFITPIFLYNIIIGLEITDQYKYLFLGLIILLNACLTFLITKDKNISNDNKYLLDLLSRYKDELLSAVWYSIPYRTTTLAVALGYGKSTFEYQYGNHSLEIHEKYFSTYPYLKWNISTITANKVTHILVQKSIFKEAKELSGFSELELNFVGENDMYILYRK